MSSDERHSQNAGGGLGGWDFYVPFGDLREPRNDKRGGEDEEEQRQHQQQRQPQEKQETTTTRRQVFEFSQMAMPYFRENAEGRCVFFVLMILMLLNSAVRVFFSFLARDFWSALGDKDVDTFYQIMKQFLLALLVLAPINVFYRFQQQRLAIKWRTWMTHRMLKLYYSNRVYYSLEKQLQKSDINIDNPDQRIAEDVRSFTTYSLSLCLTIAVSFIDLSCFSVILYMIEPQLFFSIIGFALIGTLATVLIGKTLVALNFQMLRNEADFRYSLVRIRENAESIAFLRGEQVEGHQVRQRFARVIENAYAIIGTQRNLDFFTTLYNYLTWILPVVVIAPHYFAGTVDLGVVQQASSAFGHVLDDLSIIVNEFESLTSFSASIDRLYQFVSAIQKADPDRDESMNPLINNIDAPKDGLFNTNTTTPPPSSTGMNRQKPATALSTTTTTTATTARDTIDLVQMSNDTTTALSIRNLCLCAPDYQRTLLLHSLNLELKWGQSLLISGPSGVGKSSLLRAIAGLWTAGSGVIRQGTNRSEEVYFLPQRPYCPLGSLRDQLLYPSTSSGTSATTTKYAHDDDDNDNDLKTTTTTLTNDDLLRILEDVNLPDLAERAGNGDALGGLDCEMDWSNTLSLGEQQRLAFARILVNRPRLVILDESTSAMDVASEERMYHLLKTRLGGSSASTSTCSYVSVGHRPTLAAHHDRRLHLKRGGNTTEDDCLDSSNNEAGRLTDDSLLD